jgi:hypothetical protein
MAYDAEGLPKFDKSGGLWIWLTVCGVKRPGYGNTDKTTDNGDAEKEIIGDALRNAAMRFGCALELWHKSKDKPKITYGNEKPNGNTSNPNSKPQNGSPKPDPEFKGELKDFVMTVGGPKIKGKKLGEINPDDLKSTVDYFTSNGQKAPTGKALEPITKAIKFLEENIPF